jgi:hypothetical protein
MEKGGRMLEGKEAQRIGEGQDGVVTSFTAELLRTEQGLELKREMFYMTDTGRSDAGGPIMEATSTGVGYARDTIRFSKGIRGVKFWLEGPLADQYLVQYEVLLTSGLQQTARNGLPAGDWTPKVSSTQHQLVWLSLSVTPVQGPKTQ